MARAHPRSRGENETWLPSNGGPKGSSPLTRGKLAYHGPAHDRDRLIPAHAGKTDCDLVADLERRAHPRSRGENLVLGEAYLHLTGSSPLTRGKRGPGSV